MRLLNHIKTAQTEFPMLVSDVLNMWLGPTDRFFSYNTYLK